MSAPAPSTRAARYASFAYHRFQKKRTYVWGSWSKWYWARYDVRGQLVLDFGSGGGGEGSAICQRFRKVNGSLAGYYGYDSDQEIQAWLRERGCFYDFYADDARRGQFDFVLGNQIYEHLDGEERIALIERSFALLKPGGSLVLTYPFNLYNMNFKYFWEDITHKPVGVEAEAGLISMFGFETEVFVGGLKGDPFGWAENILCLVRNLALGFPPFWLVSISARKPPTTG